MGFQNSYVIFRVGHGKCLHLLTRWVGGVKKGQKHSYVIFEWSLNEPLELPEKNADPVEKRISKRETKRLSKGIVTH